MGSQNHAPNICSSVTRSRVESTEPKLILLGQIGRTRDTSLTATTLYSSRLISSIKLETISIEEQRWIADTHSRHQVACQSLAGSKLSHSNGSTIHLRSHQNRDRAYQYYG